MGAELKETFGRERLRHLNCSLVWLGSASQPPVHNWSQLDETFVRPVLLDSIEHLEPSLKCRIEFLGARVACSCLGEGLNDDIGDIHSACLIVEPYDARLSERIITIFSHGDEPLGCNRVHHRC